MELRRVFDSIPEKFDKWRPRYCDEAFSNIIESCKLDFKNRLQLFSHRTLTIPKINFKHMPIFIL